MCLTEISGLCRYIDAPMADVATRQPMLAPMEPMEERAAAARERHALHSAEGMPHPALSLLHVFSLEQESCLYHIRIPPVEGAED